MDEKDRQTLERLLNEYNDGIAIIRENRRIVRQNKDVRQRLAIIKKELYTMVKPKVDNGISLYRIIQDSLGVIDNRFHILLGIFQKAGDVPKGTRKLKND